MTKKENNPQNQDKPDNLIPDDEAKGGKKNILPFIIVLFLLGLGILYYESKQYERGMVAVIGQTAPPISLTNLQNYDVELSDYKGKVVIVNFWATWCPPCLEEIPSLVSLNNKFKKDDFVLLAVSIDNKIGVSDMTNFAIAHKMDFQILLDPTGGTAKRYGTSKIPESYVISKQGIIVKKYVGAIDWNNPEVLDLIKGELSKPAK